MNAWNNRCANIARIVGVASSRCCVIMMKPENCCVIFRFDQCEWNEKLCES